ncbi:hypothetical protein IWQ62_005302, partial [Dispira parvispora]
MDSSATTPTKPTTPCAVYQLNLAECNLLPHMIECVPVIRLFRQCPGEGLVEFTRDVPCPDTFAER